MKRFISLIAVSLLVLAPFAGCEDLVLPEIPVEEPEVEYDPPVQVLFTLNTNDWAFPDRSAESIRFTLEIHEKYGVPLDVYFCDPAFQSTVENAPDIIEKLKSSKLFAVSYHLRPPTPYAGGGDDFINLDEMSQQEAYQAILEYEEHRVDLQWGTPIEEEPGGYQFVKDTIGYAPIIVGHAQIHEDVASAVYKDKGAVFQVSHAGTSALGDTKDGLYLRPEDAGVKYFDYLAAYQAGETTGEQIVEENITDDSSTYFLNIKMHENDYYARPAPLWAVYATDHQPPYNTSLAAQVELYTEAETAAMKQAYEEAVAYVAEHPERFNAINAFDLQEMIGAVEVTTTPVYVTLFSHNERTLSRFGKFRDSLEDYLEYREHLLKIAGLIHSYGLRYSWQTDYVILEAIENHEAMAVLLDPYATLGKPLLQYLSENLGVSIEAHAHESQNPEPWRWLLPPNYADLIYMIETIGGVEPAAVLGGTATGQRTIVELTAGITANVYSGTWVPEIISGYVYEPGHAPGADSTLSGVWRPLELNPDDYAVDDPSSSIVTIGNGNSFGQFSSGPNTTKPIDSIQALVEQIENGEVESGKIYTSSIGFPVDHFVDDEELYEQLEEVLATLKALAEAGQIVPATHPQVLEIWNTQFESEPNAYQLP